MARKKKEMPKEARVPKDAWAAKDTGTEMDDEEADRQGKWDLDKLMEAEEIKADGKRMKHVHKHMHKKMQAIRSLQDLKDAAEMVAEKNKKKEGYVAS